jgi:hypothetical protein
MIEKQPVFDQRGAVTQLEEEHMPRIVHIAIKVDDLEKRPTFTVGQG